MIGMVSLILECLRLVSQELNLDLSMCAFLFLFFLLVQAIGSYDRSYGVDPRHGMSRPAHVGLAMRADVLSMMILGLHAVPSLSLPSHFLVVLVSGKMIVHVCLSTFQYSTSKGTCTSRSLFYQSSPFQI